MIPASKSFLEINSAVSALPQIVVIKFVKLGIYLILSKSNSSFKNSIPLEFV